MIPVYSDYPEDSVNDTERLCWYCDLGDMRNDPGDGPKEAVKMYTLGGDDGWFHPSCYDEMMKDEHDLSDDRWSDEG